MNLWLTSHHRKSRPNKFGEYEDLSISQSSGTTWSCIITETVTANSPCTRGRPRDGRAREIVSEQKAAVEFLAKTLMAQETLEGPELDAVFEQVRQKMVDPPE